MKIILEAEHALFGLTRTKWDSDASTECGNGVEKTVFFIAGFPDMYDFTDDCIIKGCCCWMGIVRNAWDEASALNLAIPAIHLRDATGQK